MKQQSSFDVLPLAMYQSKIKDKKYHACRANHTKDAVLTGGDHEHCDSDSSDTSSLESRDSEEDKNKRAVVIDTKK